MFLVVIALMLLKLFNLACEVSRLTDKVEQLSQEVALNKKEFGDNLQNKR